MCRGEETLTGCEPGGSIPIRYAGALGESPFLFFDRLPGFGFEQKIAKGAKLRRKIGLWDHPNRCAGLLMRALFCFVGFVIGCGGGSSMVKRNERNLGWRRSAFRSGTTSIPPMSINKEILRWSLEELASEEEQKRLWLGLSKDVMSSFEEAWCGVFDDSGLARFMEKGLVEIEHGDQIAQMVSHLHSLLKKLPVNAPPIEIISHPLMGEVRKACSRLLESSLVKGCN